MELAGKVAIVTGASRGVGAAAARALAAEGMLVACVARATDAAPLRLPGTIDATVRSIVDAGGDALAVPANLARDEDVERMVAATVAHYGRVDVLVNNAAITFPGDLDIDRKRYDLVFAVDVRAPFLATRLVAEDMRARGEGAIVNVSSVAGVEYFPGLMVYGMAKAALERLTAASAELLRPHGIAVNTLRIDLPVASEGFVANLPGVDHSDWLAPEVAARAVVWMLRQPLSRTGHHDSLATLLPTV